MAERLIDYLELTRLTNGDQRAFHMAQLALLKKSGALDSADIKTEAEQYALDYQNLDNAQLEATKSEYTAEIVDFDRLRDSISRELRDRNNLAGKGFFATDAERQASARLSTWLDKCKNAPSESYEKATASYTDLTQKLLGECAADVELLGFGALVNELVRFNDEVKTRLESRAIENAEKTKITVKELRLRADSSYSVLTERLNAEAIISRGSNLGVKACIRYFNETVHHYNLLLSKNSDGKLGTSVKNWSAQQYGEGVSEGGISGSTGAPAQDKYPNAREWTNMIDVNDFKLGDICFVVIDGEKKYYEMIDESNFNLKPYGEEGYLGWKALA